VLVKNYAHLQELMALNEPNTEIETIYVIMTLEGAHNLHASRPAQLSSVLTNTDKMKSWDHKPFFITFAHHFYNEFCGHAESFTDVIQDWLTNQEPFMNTGINAMGWEVLKKLIDNTDGKRIHIDIKHMSALSRKQYIEFLKQEHAEEYSQKQLPLIVSHGSCNGLHSMDNPNHTPGLESTATKMYSGEINFYDNEILELARSGGIFGLQLDERRIGSKQYINEVHLTFASRTKRMHSNSKLVWNNIQHIVQLLDQNDLFAWDCIAMGTDKRWYHRSNQFILDGRRNGRPWSNTLNDMRIISLQTLTRCSKMNSIESQRLKWWIGYSIVIRWSFSGNILNDLIFIYALNKYNNA
jgi:hypothetical protein